MDWKFCISVCKKFHPYSLAVLSSVKFKVKDLTTVFNTVPPMCFRFMFLQKLKQTIEISFQ